MTKRFLSAFIAFFVLVVAVAPAQESSQSAAAVFQRNVGLWIVANVYMGNPACYSAEISQAGNTYRITVHQMPHNGIMCTMEMTIRPVATLFKMPAKPAKVRIAIGTEAATYYSVGSSDAQK